MRSFRFVTVTWQFPLLIASATSASEKFRLDFAARLRLALLFLCPPSSPFSQHILSLLIFRILFSHFLYSAILSLYLTRRNLPSFYSLSLIYAVRNLPPITAQLRSFFPHKLRSLLRSKYPSGFLPKFAAQLFVACLIHIVYFHWYLCPLPFPMLHNRFRLHRGKLPTKF